MLNMKDMNTWINKDTFLIHMIIKKKYEANNRHIFVVTCLSEALVMPSFLPRDLLGRSQSLLILIFASVVSRDRYY